MKEILLLNRPPGDDYEVFGANRPLSTNSKLGVRMKCLLADGEEEKPDGDGPGVPRLGLRDLVALAVAAIETFLLPLLAIAVVIVFIAVLLRIRP
jgi:hypothetical protein